MFSITTTQNHHHCHHHQQCLLSGHFEIPASEVGGVNVGGARTQEETRDTHEPLQFRPVLSPGNYSVEPKEQCLFPEAMWTQAGSSWLHNGVWQLPVDCSLGSAQVCTYGDRHTLASLWVHGSSFNLSSSPFHFGEAPGGSPSPLC